MTDSSHLPLRCLPGSSEGVSQSDLHATAETNSTTSEPEGGPRTPGEGATRHPEADAIVQYFVAGLTVREVAIEMRKSESTIKRLNRAHDLRGEANDLKAARASKIAARIASGTEHAVDVLVTNLDHENPTVQNSSATRLLNQSLRFEKVSGGRDEGRRDAERDLVNLYRDVFAVFMEHAEKNMSREEHQKFLGSLYEDKFIRRSDEILQVLVDALRQYDNP